MVNRFRLVFFFFYSLFFFFLTVFVIHYKPPWPRRRVSFSSSDSFLVFLLINRKCQHTRGDVSQFRTASAEFRVDSRRPPRMLYKRVAYRNIIIITIILRSRKRERERRKYDKKSKTQTDMYIYFFYYDRLFHNDYYVYCTPTG